MRASCHPSFRASCYPCRSDSRISCTCAAVTGCAGGFSATTPAAVDWRHCAGFCRRGRRHNGIAPDRTARNLPHKSLPTGHLLRFRRHAAPDEMLDIETSSLKTCPRHSESECACKQSAIRSVYSPKLTVSMPRNSAACPSSSSIRSSWLYFAMRSVREAEPVLICPAPVATARSAIKVSSVSPLRCEMTDV